MSMIISTHDFDDGDDGSCVGMTLSSSPIHASRLSLSSQSSSPSSPSLSMFQEPMGNTHYLPPTRMVNTHQNLDKTNILEDNHVSSHPNFEQRRLQRRRHGRIRTRTRSSSTSMIVLVAATTLMHQLVHLHLRICGNYCITSFGDAFLHPLSTTTRPTNTKTIGGPSADKIRRQSIYSFPSSPSFSSNNHNRLHMILHPIDLDGGLTSLVATSHASLSAAAEAAAASSSSTIITASTAAGASTIFEPIQQTLQNLPFQDVAKQLSQSLDIGQSELGRQQALQQFSEEETRLVLGSVGSDILVFLAASVVVTTVTNAIGITPILGYLIVGALLGPNNPLTSTNMGMFGSAIQNTQASVELGDFGILFLLFSEGLEVTTQRLYKLTNYLPLGLAQISLTTGILTLSLLSVGRFYAGGSAGSDATTTFTDTILSGNFDDLISNLLINIQDPIQSCVLAITCALSTSAFIFPVLKEKGWEEQPAGAAATTILLLQDLLVAPLLVVLPLIVNVGPTDYNAIGFLTAKATIGFGTVVFIGSYILKQLFGLVSRTRSSETFVALCLLVSVGMGEIARSLGLTDTAGAFAAGVLLANTNYRAQIQADIVPFKGILLGIFFMDAGSNFDFDLVVREWPTVLGGAVGLILIKALTLIAATRVPKQVEPNRLPTVDALRIGILLSGGGEFAFVVLALAEKIDILPKDVIGLLTAIVLVTMGVTPVLGDVAEAVSRPFIEEDSDSASITENEVMKAMNVSSATIDDVAEDSILVIGHSEVGRATVRALTDLRDDRAKARDETTTTTTSKKKIEIVSFSRNVDLIDSVLVPSPGAAVFYGDGANPNLIRSSGITDPRAIFVTYQDHNQALSATSRLRVAFPDAPIYVRAAKRKESRDLMLAGATDVIIEADELARSVPKLMDGIWDGPLALDTEYDEDQEYKQAAATAANLPLSVVDDLFEVYESLDLCAAGLVSRQEIIDMFSKTKDGFVASDDKILEMEHWLKTTTAAHFDPMDRIEFCRLYARAPQFVKESFGKLRNKDSK